SPAPHQTPACYQRAEACKGSKTSDMPGTGHQARPRTRNRRHSSGERIMTAVLAPPATTVVTPTGPRWDDACQELTLASVWRAVASSQIGDELLEWPPDPVPLTAVIRHRPQAHPFPLSPPPP